jgi:hypothetical protein
MKRHKPCNLIWKKWLDVPFSVIGLALLLSGFLGACGGGGGDSAPVTPTVTYLAAPTVTPSDGATDISVSTSISADFSEALDPASATAVMTLRASGGATISANVVCLGATLTSFPTAPLAYGETYTATIGTGLKGTSGKSLELPKVWSFTTVTAAPGDPLNYFPADPGRFWNFSGTINTTPFVNTLTITGTTVVNGVTVDVYTESNHDNSLAMITWRFKDLNGLWYHGTDDSADTLTPQLVPYREMVFPLTPGVGHVVLTKTDLDYGVDLDLDGINERCDVTIRTVMEKLEDLFLTAGDFLATAKINTVTRIDVTLSKDKSLFVGQEWNSKWYAPNVGPVKRDSLFTTTQPGAPDASIHVIEELSAYGPTTP